jgi:hypothetical protein
MVSVLNSEFESLTADPPQSIWADWLWGCDLAEPVTVDCLLNRSHLLGILIARFRALREPELMNVCISTPHMVHQGIRVAVMTPRQLKDAIEDLQLHWSMYIESEDIDEITELVDACLTRFGALNLGPTSYEDIGMRDSTDPKRMNVLCMRRLISILCVLYRHLDLLHRWIDPPLSSVEAELIQDFHVQSSMDEFHKHMMRSDLPPAALLIYRQDFAGFYHCVSQAVYFHFPGYERKTQLDLDTLRLGLHPIHALACMVEMYPEMNVCNEDEQPKQDTWNWMLMGKRLYLLDSRHNRVYFAPSVLQLMAAFFSS